jgi:TRAP-type mannitol/chloroaromatic compound transport system permease large subunit
VCLTWNPTRYNYVEWARAQWSSLMPLVVFVGLVLLIAWIFFGRATARSLGVLGITLSLALAATVIWISFYYGLVSTASTTLISWIVLALLAAILAMGMSWSHLRRSWSGQVDVDDKDGR